MQNDISQYFFTFLVCTYSGTGTPCYVTSPIHLYAAIKSLGHLARDQPVLSLLSSHTMGSQDKRWHCCSRLIKVPWLQDGLDPWSSLHMSPVDARWGDDAPELILYIIANNL